MSILHSTLINQYWVEIRGGYAKRAGWSLIVGVFQPLETYEAAKALFDKMITQDPEETYRIRKTTEEIPLMWVPDSESFRYEAKEP